MSNYAIIAAAGSGSRAKLNKNKLLAQIGGETVIEKTVGTFLRSPLIDEIFVTASEDDLETFRSLFADNEKIRVVKGGATRTQSVRNALDEIKEDGVVLIHDGARPYLTTALIERCVTVAKDKGSAIAAVPAVDTVAIIKGDEIIDTTRKNVLSVQTPQAFKLSLIKHAYSKITAEDVFTDDAGVFCKYIGRPRVVEGEADNIKLTYRKDFESEILRVGCGFDLHRLVPDRPLILGGVNIPHDKGLLGHSDADALLHAVMDALLSAASLRDIGYHFPDTDPKYKDISSMLLFAEVIRLLRESGYAVNNISATIMAEKPKLKKYVPLMTENVSRICSIPPSAVGIGCTTLEGIGTVGREEGIAVQAYCSIKAIKD